ncbi:STAS domain-containing protein [Actinoplanes xinjiangensis]|uniref:Anti-sigma factor antagonist n=1 Tax=Actinoplanes xinjiangensis TaxID=512350 RepID=A0A316EGS9_9ACTN|nr:STAS domain-containing protein [Actinoplanes xinjiangensis]PWK30185.1 anti-sigma B factor antagonist [Actinoplanes xinjiangensis]GIF44613.1 anti-sigma factor antagonist [Actinoplanes xinjiangensis]
MAFDCTIERDGDTVVLAPEGELDLENAGLLRQVVQQVIDRRDCTRLDLEMSAVTFLDSSGLGMLVAAQRAAAANGITLRLHAPGPVVRIVLEVTDLYDRLVGEPGTEPVQPGGATRQ